MLILYYLFISILLCTFAPVNGVNTLLFVYLCTRQPRGFAGAFMLLTALYLFV